VGAQRFHITEGGRARMKGDAGRREEDSVGLPPEGASEFVTALIRYRRLLVVLLELVLVTVSYASAFALRFDGNIPLAQQDIFWSTLPVLLVLRLGAFALYRLHTGWWRYVGMRDMVALLKAMLVSSVLFAAGLFVLGLANHYPRSVLIVDGMLTTMLVGGVRFALRAIRESRRRAPTPSAKGRRVLIIGAGDAGELLLREMRNNPRLGYDPVGFVDDDPRKVGFHIHGVPVLGGTSALPAVATAHPVDELIIAIPSATRAQIQEIVDRCLALKLPFRILPAIAALSGHVAMSQVRPVRLEDLLGREPVDLDASMIRADIAGRRILITGAGGSIGAELARQIAGYGPAMVGLVDRSENALFLIHQELTRTRPDVPVRTFLCDICDAREVRESASAIQPDVVYHAAAFKHVPMMEAHLAQAVRNNVFGTHHVATVAASHGAKFVLISTDKAVAPCSVMGATKRLAEKLVLSLASSGPNHFVAVRFGNVLGSNGSVVPIFTQQIADGGPITVTHPDATRYFMTIPEAVQLVLQASVLAEARDKIVMLEMGEPVRIVDLARNLIRLSGLEPDVDMPIVFTGLRPGEKLHEQLTFETEETLPTRYDKIRVVKTDLSTPLDRGLEQLREAAEARDEKAVLRRLQELVPEFVPQASLLAALRDRMADPRSISRTVG